MDGRCTCRELHHPPRLVVVTGGPGAGKTASLEVVRRDFCRHVDVVPEAASILFRGGFPRLDTATGRKAAQVAIYQVQRQLERMALDRNLALAVCDRGSLDGIAYWPGPVDSYLDEVGSSLARERARYAAVIHLRTPGSGHGYDHSNPVRVEAAEEAQRIDERILAAWESHPRRHVVPATDRFLEKVDAVLAALVAELPPCCRLQPPP